MRFKEFLNEEKIDDAFIENVANTLKKECIPFLEMIDYDIDRFKMWRGIGAAIDKNFQLLGVHKNRQPLDTNILIHKFFDQWFFDKFGIHFRSQSIFVSPSESFAENFGPTFLVFPKGKFDYCWSLAYKDLTDAVSLKMHNWTIIKTADKLPSSEHALYQMFLDDAEMEKFMEDGKWNFNEGLKRVLTSRSDRELMIHCDKYYALATNNISSNNWEKLCTMVKEK